MWHFDGTNGTLGGWGILSIVMMSIFFIAIIGLTIWGIKRFTQTADASKKAMGIAKERYARGEISKQEYEQLKRDLS
jgi:putative membrane protein